MISFLDHAFDAIAKLHDVEFGAVDHPLDPFGAVLAAISTVGPLNGISANGYVVGNLDLLWE